MIYSIFSVLLIAVTLIGVHLICVFVMGKLIGHLFVRYVEYNSSKIKKYINYKVIGIFLLIVLTVLIFINIGGFEVTRSSRVGGTWKYGIGHLLFLYLGIYLTVRKMFKKKGLSFS